MNDKWIEMIEKYDADGIDFVSPFTFIPWLTPQSEVSFSYTKEEIFSGKPVTYWRGSRPLVWKKFFGLKCYLIEN